MERAALLAADAAAKQAAADALKKVAEQEQKRADNAKSESERRALIEQLEKDKAAAIKAAVDAAIQAKDAEHQKAVAAQKAALEE